MKKLYAILGSLLLTIYVFTQAPQKISYQAVIRDADNKIVANHAVGIRISILQGSEIGTSVYKETYNPVPQTNTNGLVTIEIGGGIPVTGTFSDIDWTKGPYFIKSEADPAGGANYSIIGTSQLLSVPYALHAKTAENNFSGNYNDLTNKPALFDGNYNSLTNKPLGNKKGDLLYWNDTTWVIIPIGKAGQILQINSFNIPSWSGGTFPILTTNEISSIESTSATSGGNITSDGGSSVTFRGVCWSLNPGPTIADSKTSDGNGNGSFTSEIKGLKPNTTYYICAYATNTGGSGYGNVLSFKTKKGDETITDIDGNVYKIVTIGTQVWMAENLKVTHYRNTDAIPNITDDKLWSNLTTGAYCDNNNTPSNSITYGKLYNFLTVLDSRNLCPSGWHVPSDNEWTKLAEYLGGESFAGGKLKEQGTTHWKSPNTGATNESGFTALAGGKRLNNGAYYPVGSISGQWWSSTTNDSFTAFSRYLYNDYVNFSRNFIYINYGLSVRCIKD